MTATSKVLTAGTATVSITPDRPLHLQGYGDRGGPATGTLDPLEVRAIVFNDGRTSFAILSADLIGLDYASVQRIRAVAEAASGIPGTNVIVACSHTHSGPAVQILGDSPVDPEYQQWLEQTMGEVVAEANRSLQPVTVSAGEGTTDFSVNRRLRTPDGTLLQANPAGIVDHRVKVLRVDPTDRPVPKGTLGGRILPQENPLALLFSYACHPTVMGKDNLRYSSDYPGSARKVIENAYQTRSGDGGTTAMFLPGCCGDQRPHLLNGDGRFRGASDHELSVLGRMLGSEVVKVAESIELELIGNLAIASRTVSLPYAHVPDEAELMVAIKDEKLSWWAQGLLNHLENKNSLPNVETGEVMVLQLGRHWIVTTPGETMLEIGLSIERGLVEMGLAQQDRGDMTLALGYTNGNVGYLCTSASMYEGGYEPARSYFEYLRPGPFIPEIEPTLIESALALAQEIGPTNQ